MASQPEQTPAAGYALIVNWPITAAGGVNEVILSLATQLRRRGYVPVISASLAEPATVRGTEVVRLGVDPPFTHASNWFHLVKLFIIFPLVARRLLRFLRSRNIRVVNAHYPDLDVLYFVILKAIGLYKGKILLSFHGADVETLHSAKGLYKSAWQFLITHVDANTACSEALRQSLLKFVPAAKVAAIHNASDIDLFLVDQRPAQVRRRILQVGKFEHKKGQDITLHALKLLRQTIPDAQLTLVGAEGPDLSHTRELIQQLELTGCTELHLNVRHEDVPDFMKGTDLFVLPSRKEPFGIVLLEAGASMLPVIAARVGGIPELIENGVTGLLIEPDNPAAHNLAA